MNPTSSLSTPIADFVRDYQAADFSRLHMPGHKGTPVLGCEPWDITEICGADELYQAQGIIAESESNAARLFGTARTFYSTEGSSQCIRAMLCLALRRAPRSESRPLLLAARNAHKALLYAAALLDIEIDWLRSDDTQAARSLCECPVSPATLSLRLEEAERQNRRPFAVYVTSPDYLGNLQDVSALSEVCKQYRLPLLVDNAHGAYLAFLDRQRQGGKLGHPIALGASLCCDSGHKTLPVLTGGAYLHIGANFPVTDGEVRDALCLFGSTSPSYLILQSLDICNRSLATDFPRRLEECIRRVERIRQTVKQWETALSLPTSLIFSNDEPTKLVLDGSAIGRSGAWIADFLRSRQIECEYADPRFVVLMFSPYNTERDDTRLLNALHLLSERSDKRKTASTQEETVSLSEFFSSLYTRCSIRQAVFSPQERIPARCAVGRICALPTVSCPPAIPIVVSGEEISPLAVRLFRQYGVETVAVLKEKVTEED